MTHAGAGLAFALASLLGVASAGAGDPKPRPVPDYGGRGEPPTTVGDVAIWVPRVVAAPLYLTTEFLLRRPMGVAITFVDKHRLPARVIDFFTLTDDGKVRLFPTAFIDFGFLPSVGAYFAYDDFLASKNDLRARAGTWGPDWLSFRVTDRIALGAASRLSLHGEWTRRKDWVFHGLGPRSRPEDRSRYAADLFDVGPAFDLELSRGIHLHSGVGARGAQFTGGSCCLDPALGDLVSAGRFPSPPGFSEGYAGAYERIDVTWDTRAERPADQSGVRVEIEGQPAQDLEGPARASWIRFGATAAGFVDVTGTNRVLSLAVSTLFADPIPKGGQIPFREQVVLGGSRYMRGFLDGRLVDRSALVATLQYEWPIWVWIDGTLEASAGNVFGPDLENFAPELCRLSSGLGLRTNNSPDAQLEVLVGFGTEPFADGASVSSFRLAVGATRGF